MKTATMNWIRMSVLLLVVLVAGKTEAVQADSDKITISITDVRVEDTVYTPHYQVETEQDHQQGASQRWLRLGVYFTTEGGWVDELEIRQMAIFEGPDENSVILSASERYINLEPGDHYVYMYLHPSYVKRYAIDASNVDSAAMILFGGKELARKESDREHTVGWSLKPKKEWERGYLLNHTETPFWFINYDFKEVLKR